MTRQPDRPIDLRSDTQTLPTERMLRSVLDARLGDDTLLEDPTTRRLEEAVAERLGMESALLVLSGTMANLVALMTHCRPGEEVFLDADSHLLRNEAGGLTAVAGVVPTVAPADRGHLVPEALERAIRPAAVNRPRPRLVWLENTHNRAGGTVLTAARMAELVEVGRRHDLAVHVDGARLFNAVAASGTPIDELVRGADSVALDFTKGLSCPVGAVLAGSRAFIEEARRRRRVIGGGMRQSGFIAAACLVALETTVDRLADDHLTACKLADGLVDVDGFEVDGSRVETNIVFARIARFGSSGYVLGALREAGVLASDAPPDHVRFVTHRHIDDEAIGVALERIRNAAANLAANRAPAAV
jgi:threonine aldolase